ncbi:hypothetical protein [Pseudomonas aeruginosa]|uniref:hypothetical protein n=1 Tax=Pseudomonas aeruginosa TaxID=287 RepID=UPI0034E0A7E7
MTNFEFGKLLLTDKAPTLTQRENVIRNNLTDWRLEGGYIRVHKVAVTSPGEFYACVSYPFRSNTMQTYVAGTIQCRRKDDGYWLNFDCFLATASVPFTLTGCPREIFDAGNAVGMMTKVNEDWYQACLQTQLIRDKEQALKKGAVFKLQAGAPSRVLGGERATFAVVQSKSKALYISPGSRSTFQGGIDDLIEHYDPVDANTIPEFLEQHSYTEVGELLFDLSGTAPALKGRLAKGVKAKLLAKVRKERERVMVASFEAANRVNPFTTGAWLA